MKGGEAEEKLQRWKEVQANSGFMIFRYPDVNAVTCKEAATHASKKQALGRL